MSTKDKIFHLITSTFFLPFERKHLTMRLLNATISTTTSTANVISTHSLSNDQLKRILSYALPAACFTLLFLLIIGLTFRQRRRVMEKWASFRQRRNTSSKFSSTTGIRRDSEFDSFQHEHVQITPIEYHQNKVMQLNTIS